MAVFLVLNLIVVGCGVKGYRHKEDDIVPTMVNKIAAAHSAEQIFQLFSASRDQLVIALKNRAEHELALLLRKKGFEVKHNGKNNILSIDIFPQNNHEYIVSVVLGNYGRRTKLFLFQNDLLIPIGLDHVETQSF